VSDNTSLGLGRWQEIIVRALERWYRSTWLDSRGPAGFLYWLATMPRHSRTRHQSQLCSECCLFEWESRTPSPISQSVNQSIR